MKGRSKSGTRNGNIENKNDNIDENKMTAKPAKASVAVASPSGTASATISRTALARGRGGGSNASSGGLGALLSTTKSNTVDNDLLSPIISSSPALAYGTTGATVTSSTATTAAPGYVQGSIVAFGSAEESSASLTALQTAMKSLMTKQSIIQSRYEKTESALKMRAKAQDAVIAELRAENTRLRIMLEAKESSAAVSSSSSVSNQQQQQQQSSSSSTLPSSLRVVEVFRALTAMDVTPRRVVAVDTSSSSSTAVVGSEALSGIYDFETEDPETGSVITFALDFFPVQAPGLQASSSSTADDASQPQPQQQYPTGIAVEYTPGMGSELLPAFLQSVITFGSDQAPMFLAKMTEALRHMDYEGNGEEMEQEEDGLEDTNAVAAATTTSTSTKSQTVSATVASTGSAVASPEVVFQRRSIATTASKQLSASFDDQLRAVASAEGLVDGVTPEAVKRGRHLGVLNTPSATAATTAAFSSLINAVPPAPPTPAATTMTKIASGLKAPAPTPNHLMGMGMMQVVEEGTQHNNKEKPHTTNTNNRRSLSVDRLVVSRPAMGETDMMTMVAPTTALATSRRSNRVAMGSVALVVPRAQSVRSRNGRRSLTHVVTSDGFLHELSPKGKVLQMNQQQQ